MSEMRPQPPRACVWWEEINQGVEECWLGPHGDTGGGGNPVGDTLRLAPSLCASV